MSEFTLVGVECDCCGTRETDDGKGNAGLFDEKLMLPVAWARVRVDYARDSQNRTRSYHLDVCPKCRSIGTLALEAAAQLRHGNGLDPKIKEVL